MPLLPSYRNQSIDGLVKLRFDENDEKEKDPLTPLN